MPPGRTTDLRAWRVAKPFFFTTVTSTMATTLSPEQKQTVAAWVAAGDNLSAVQKKLAEHFKVSMTYMDVRFLVDDLGLELKNAAPKADTSDLSKANVGAVPPPRADQAGSAAPAGKKGFVDKLK